MSDEVEPWILAVDPGDKTGWATLKYNGGDPIDMGIVPAEYVPDLLETMANREGLKAVVFEDWLLYKKQAHNGRQTGSRFKAVQVIGQLKMFARQQHCGIVIQGAGILSAAEKASGVKPPSNHDLSHDVDAFNHGYYWLVQNKKAKSVLEKEGLK